MLPRIQSNVDTLHGGGVPVRVVTLRPRVVYPTYFSDRSMYVAPELSVRVVAALQDIGMVNTTGYVTQDPR